MLDASTREFDLLLRFASLIYASIIFFRVLTYAARSAFPNTDTRQIVLWATVFMVSAIFMSSGGANQYSAVLALLNATVLISAFTIIYGSMATGSLIRNNSTGAITAIILIIAEISLSFIEPLLSATFAVGALALNMYLEYQDMYGFLYNSFWNADWARYMLVYPPLILLFTFSDIVFVSEFIGQVTTSIIAVFLTLLGMAAGYFEWIQT